LNGRTDVLRDGYRALSELTDPDALRGRRVVVMGVGSFGGGAAAVRFLAEQGASVLVSEQRPADQSEDSVRELSQIAGVDWRGGGHELSHFDGADLVVVNPAVRPDHPILMELDRRGVPLTTEISLFWQLLRGDGSRGSSGIQSRTRIVAVTGSNGKSTTTALTHALLQSTGRTCWLGGNIGCSLLPELKRIGPDDFVVLELSSFQLHWLNHIRARPDIAIVTNFTPNHLDWHHSLDHYRQSKQSILRWQQPDDWCVLNASDSEVSNWPHPARPVMAGSDRANTQSRADTAWLDVSVAQLRVNGIEVDLDLSAHLNLRGKHNRENALLALCAALIAGVPPNRLASGLAKFQPLPHRLQHVGTVDGRLFYNDSIATTPESAIAGLHSFEEPIVVLAGGYDKQVDLSAFASAIAHRARAVALLGTTGPVLDELIATGVGASGPERFIATSFRDAFDWAWSRSRPGDVVLLSPGCASYDWFRSFVDRGNRFSAMVAERLNNADGSETK